MTSISSVCGIACSDTETIASVTAPAARAARAAAYGCTAAFRKIILSPSIESMSCCNHNATDDSYIAAVTSVAAMTAVTSVATVGKTVVASISELAFRT